MTLDDLVELLVGGATLTGATLSRPRATGTDEPPRITVQPVTLKRGKRVAVCRQRRYFTLRVLPAPRHLSTLWPSLPTLPGAAGSPPDLPS